MKKRRKPPNLNNSNLDGPTLLPRSSVLKTNRKLSELVRQLLPPIQVIGAIISVFRFMYGLLRLLPKVFEFFETLLQTLPWF
jgi:hypothetical protein